MAKICPRSTSILIDPSSTRVRWYFDSISIVVTLSTLFRADSDKKTPICNSFSDRSSRRPMWRSSRPSPRPPRPSRTARPRPPPSSATSTVECAGALTGLAWRIAGSHVFESELTCCRATCVFWPGGRGRAGGRAALSFAYAHCRVTCVRTAPLSVPTAPPTRALPPPPRRPAAARSVQSVQVESVSNYCRNRVEAVSD